MSEQMDRLKAEAEYDATKDMFVSLFHEGVDIFLIARAAKVSVEQIREWIEESNRVEG